MMRADVWDRIQTVSRFSSSNTVDRVLKVRTAGLAAALGLQALSMITDGRVA